MMEASGNIRQSPLLGIWQEYKVAILLGGLSFFLITTAVVLLIKSVQVARPIEFSSDAEASTSAHSLPTIFVDIAGAVEQPGVYQLPFGSRVEDAIAAAGGLSREVDQAKVAVAINRAAKLVDGAKLYIPKQGESQEGAGLTSQNASSVGGLTVSVNTASQSELEALSGIGPVTAGKIITNRPYQSLEELLTKKVLGQSLYDKLKDQLSL